jgi:hypothetical protein
MAKTVTNVLKFVASKIEIGVSTSEAEPGSYTDLGLQSETTLKITMTKISEREAGGAEVQKGYDCKVETDSMEVLNASTLETSFKNQFVWLKATPIGTPGATNPYVRAKNFICNMEVDVDLSAKGKSALKISGMKYCNSITEFMTTAAS